MSKVYSTSSNKKKNSISNMLFTLYGDSCPSARSETRVVAIINSMDRSGIVVSTARNFNLVIHESG
jgi:hypothetical protein